MRNVFVLIGFMVLVSACAMSGSDIADSLPTKDPTPSPALPSPEGSGSGKADAASSSTECPTKCVPSDSCHTSTCDKAEGICVEKEKPDGYGCDTGACNAGKCEPIPICFGQYPQHFLHCGGASAYYRDLTTALYPKNGVTNYVCANGEVANDVALEFDPPEGSQVTVTLKVTNGPDADLDLIVLEDVCMGTAKCVNAPSGGGHAGVTAGTGTETVTFTAAAYKKYYVVVDGKTTTPVSFHVEVQCN